MKPVGRARGLGDLLHGGRVEKIDLDALRAKLFFDLEGRDAYVRFGVLLVLSVLIASGGVITDSTATVIGAMIVAPLMTPIMATALAITSGDGRRILRSLGIVAVGVAVAVGLSYLFGLLSITVVDAATNGQVSGRISPRTTDLVVALASGAAGAFALSRENVSDALPGVAISISLVPPLCVVGIMLANGDPSASAGALLLFLTNFIAILAAGGGLLAAMGYGRAAIGSRPSHERRRATALIIVGVLVILIPLTAAATKVGQDSALEHAVTGEVRDSIAGTHLELVRVNSTNGQVEVTLLGDTGTDATFADDLAKALHRSHPDSPVRVEIVQTRVEEIPAARNP